jgi:hypothetical protein
MDIEGAAVVIGDGALESGDPVGDGRATGAIDDRVPPVEDQVAHVDDVRLLEGDDRIAAGMRRAVVLQGHDLVADCLAPRDLEGGVSEHLFGRRRLARLRGLRGARRGLHLQSRDVDMGENLPRGRAEDTIPSGVVSVVMGVDQVVELTTLRAGVDGVEAGLRGRRELRIDHDDALRVDMPADRAALAGERPNRPAHEV